MSRFGLFFMCSMIMGCSDGAPGSSTNVTGAVPVETIVPEEKKLRHYAAAISNGMKGDSLFFDVCDDGTKLQNLTFKGYWRCSGRLEQTTAGPEGVFPIINGKVSGHITEPPGGGSTSWRFDLDALLSGNTASGTFRMNINNLGCDTYKLLWKGNRKD